MIILRQREMPSTKETQQTHGCIWESSFSLEVQIQWWHAQCWKLPSIWSSLHQVQEEKPSGNVCQSSPIRTEKKTEPVERNTWQTHQHVHHIDKGNATDNLSKNDIIYTHHSPKDTKQYDTASCVSAKKTEAATLVKIPHRHWSIL